VEQVKQDLIRSRILTRQDCVIAQLCLDIPCAYVLYDQRHGENVGLIRNYLERCGVRMIGRYGSWEYSGMEDAIRQGKTVAEELIQTH